MLFAYARPRRCAGCLRRCFSLAACSTPLRLEDEAPRAEPSQPAGYLPMTASIRCFYLLSGRFPYALFEQHCSAGGSCARDNPFGEIILNDRIRESTRRSLNSTPPGAGDQSGACRSRLPTHDAEHMRVDRLERTLTDGKVKAFVGKGQRLGTCSVSKRSCSPCRRRRVVPRRR